MQFETCIQNTKLLAGTLFFISTTSNPSPGLPKLLLLFCQLNLICVLFRVRIITCLANYVSLHFSIIKSNSSNVPRGPHKMLEMPLLGELSGIEGIYFIHWRCVHFFPLQCICAHCLLRDLNFYSKVQIVMVVENKLNLEIVVNNNTVWRGASYIFIFMKTNFSELELFFSTTWESIVSYNFENQIPEIFPQ